MAGDGEEDAAEWGEPFVVRLEPWGEPAGGELVIPEVETAASLIEFEGAGDGLFAEAAGEA